MKNIFGNANRRVRRYASEQDRNTKNRDKLINSPQIQRLKGSPAYDEEIQKINKDFENERIRLGKEAIKDLQGMINEARQNAENTIFKEPSSAMVNTLLIMQNLKTLTPNQIIIYAKRYGDCPLFIQGLSERANDFGLRINVPTIEERSRMIDVLEGKYADFIRGYRNEDDMLPTAQMLYPYFKPDEYYLKSGMSVENVDKQFWKDQISIGNPNMLEADNKVADWVDVKYYFTSGEELQKFIDEKTKGLDSGKMQIVMNEILNNCPDDYGAKYRHFLATGEWLPLNEDEEE